MSTQYDMTLKGFIKAKYDLERSLAAAIVAELRKFEEATGMSPRDVNVQMVERTFVGGPSRRYVLNSVVVEVEIK